MQEEALLQIIQKQQELINLMLQSGIKISDTNSPNAQTFSYSATTKNNQRIIMVLKLLTKRVSNST